MRRMKCRYLFTVLLFLLAPMLPECNSPSDTSSSKTSDYTDGGKYGYSLSRFSSSSSMEQYLKESIEKQTGETGGLGVDTTATTAALAEDSGESGSTYSTTTLQEAAVDESDLIKTDGQYLYAVVKQSAAASTDIIALAAQPSADSQDENTFLAEYANSIRVMELSDAPPSATQISVIRPEDSSAIINSLYLVTGRESSLPDLLAVITTASDTPSDYWFYPWRWQNGTTGVTFFNVSDPVQPVQTASISVDGYLIASRRIGETLYLITRFTPNIPGYETYPLTDADVQNNNTLIQNAALSDMVPHLTQDGSDSGNLVNAENCYVPPTPGDAISSPDIISITAINLQSPDTAVSTCVMGAAEAVYVSPQSIYLATTTYTYSPAPAADDSTGGVTLMVYTAPEVTTDLHKFSLDASPPQYVGSGAVDGHLGWQQDKKSFRMGEHNGYLRVAASLGETWDDSATTLLTILKESDDADEGRLIETSRLPNNSRQARIGKAGERLYAARFLGDRAYLVTFRVTDPLYILDLSDPADPLIAGELQISGYSDYLLPIGDNFLLGIGKDAVADDTWGDIRGAWYQGVKLSLFDVTDPANPLEAGSVVLGRRGTDSDALFDHHAVSYLPASTGVPARVALPIYLHDTVPEYGGFDESSSQSYWDWTHTGLYLFEISGPDGGDAGISLAGKIIAKERSATESYDYNVGANRSVLLNDSAHFTYNGRVWSSAWGSGSSATGPQ